MHKCEVSYKLARQKLWWANLAYESWDDERALFFREPSIKKKSLGHVQAGMEGQEVQFFTQIWVFINSF